MRLVVTSPEAEEAEAASEKCRRRGEADFIGVEDEDDDDDDEEDGEASDEDEKAVEMDEEGDGEVLE